MRVEQIMTRDPVACRPEDGLDLVAQRLWDGDCGAMPVRAADGRPIAMITDRDVCMCSLFRGRPLRELRVVDAVRGKGAVAYCRADASLADAMRTLREARVRRLPVVDDAGALVGVLSLADLAREASRQRRRKHPDVSEAKVGQTLAAICEPAERLEPASAP